MSKVATESPDRPDSGPFVISRQADTQKSDAHVAQLLNIAEQCSKYLWARQEVGTVIDVDPELIKQSRSTLELTHLRLREMVDEARRWSLHPSEHEREATKLIDATMELYEQKTINAKIHNRPSVFLRPRIGKFTQGWIMWIGGDLPLLRDLHGIGDTPAKACSAFDDAFYDLRKLSDAQPAVVIPPPAPKRAPRKSKKT